MGATVSGIPVPLCARSPATGRRRASLHDHRPGALANVEARIRDDVGSAVGTREMCPYTTTSFRFVPLRVALSVETDSVTHSWGHGHNWRAANPGAEAGLTQPVSLDSKLAELVPECTGRLQSGD